MKPREYEGSNFTPVVLPNAGLIVARCYSMIHLGDMPNIYNGVLNEKYPTVPKIMLTWELPTKLAVFNEEKGQEPFVVSYEVTYSTGDKGNLSKIIRNWRGRALTAEEKTTFDPSVMVGKPCMIQVEHKTKKEFVGQQLDSVTNQNTWMQFGAITTVPEGMSCPPMLNPKMVWDWDLITSGQEAFDIEKWKKIPNWIQKKIKESVEYKSHGKQYVEAAENNTAPPAQPEVNAPVDDGGGW